MSYELKRLDSREIPSRADEVRCFVCLKNEGMRLPYFLDYHRRLGVDRFIVIDNDSDDGSREFLLDQKDVHVFFCDGSFFEGNVEPPTWTNALLNVFGHGHWCLTLDPDELFVYPDCETVGIRKLADYLEGSGADTLSTLFVDMYGDGPIRSVAYRPGAPFFDACGYFDPKPGWPHPADGRFPPVMYYGGVRERAFWHGPFKRTFPPCLTKVPFVKWRRGKEYRIVTHTISEARIAELTGALLHFKFMPGFFESMTRSVAANEGIVEKGLQERAAYVVALQKNPDLALRNDRSVKYRDSAQLVELGWMRSTPAYREFVGASATSTARLRSRSRLQSPAALLPG